MVASTDESKPAGRGRRDNGPRRFGSRAFVFWILALAAGGAAAFLLHRYVTTGVKPSAASTTKIAMAATNLELATTLAAEHIQMVDWPDSVAAPDAIRDPKAAVGRVLVAKVVKGQMLLEPMLAPRDSGKGLAALIPPSMRAVAVRVDDVVGVAGFIHPEDRVDVIVTIRPPKPENAETVSKIVMQNVEVLTVGKELETKDGARNKPVPVTVATLLVTPEGSEKLALAANQGKILLSLRSRADDREAETSGIVASALLGQLQEPRRVAASGPPILSRRAQASMAAAVPPKPAAPEKQVVEILRGDRFEQRKFEAKEAQSQ